MTLNEFKAWFEGFQEGIETTPTLPQWQKIKQKIHQIEETPFPPFKITDAYSRTKVDYDT